MNNACKVIWSHTLQQMVVVSEIVRGRGKAKSVTQGSEPHTTSTAINTGMWAAKTLAGALALAFGALTAFAPALSQSVANNALPTGGNVAAGSAAIHQSGASMLIDQASQRAVLNWQSFNVGKDAQVHFNNAGGSTLNRVTGPEASTIMGRITAPGQVIISNGNGVFFGRGSMVDVGSLIATTHSIGNEQFMAGDLSFERKGSTASVVNEGELRAKLEGYIALMAPEVRNQGLIVATKGTVALAAGEVVELQLDPNNKLTNIRVSAGQWQALVENKQAIEAEGGLVILSAMAARELQGSVVSNSGSINASSLTSVGGRIILTGDAITLKDGSKITATGATGGGQVLVGGDWQGGQNAERRVFDDPMALYQATKLTMEAGATIDASATDKGKGGKVVLWSDIALPNAVTAAHGSIQAQGGRQGGDGGQIETSGADLKVDGIQVSTLAPQGQTGEWLLDPRNITIGGSGGGTYTATADNTQISATTLQTALNTTDVTVFTGTTGSQAGNITVSAPITSGSTRTLTLKAQGSIVINSDITRSGTGGLTLRTGSGSVSGTGTLVLGGGTTLSLAHGTTLANKIALTTGGATLNLANLEVEYLLVGGGGGGTSDFGAPGGGGGGGFVTGSTSLSVGSSSSVTVGAGGTAEAAGQASTAFGGTANGGGVASTAFGNARGGSSGNGNSGGASYREPGDPLATGGGGGAGAGGVGQAGAAGRGGDGGAGRSSDITGTLRWYAGGGGGAAGVGSAANQGSGTAGGGNGTYTGNGGQNGTGNTGGGGGGVYQGSAGSGGSGIVVARYLGPSAAGTGGSIAASPGSASGYTVHTFTSAGTLTINQLSANLTGEVSGTGNLTVNATGGTLTLGGNSTYTGTTTLSGGVVQADHANALGSNSAVTLGTTAGTRLELLDHLTVGSIAGGSGTNARIELSSYKLTAGGDNTNTSFAGRIAGTSGQLEKAGTGDLTLTAANTYTGATTIAAGRLVIQSNAPDTASSQFKGPGALVIQPEGTDFSSAFSTAPKWNFAADLGGLTIGKETSANGTGDVDVNLGASNSAIRIAGPVKVYGRDVNVNGDLGSTLAGAAIDLKASGNIAQLSGLEVSTPGGHVTYWADSDNNGSGGVIFYMGASGNTTSVSTGGGNIVIGGGTDPLTGNARGTPAGVVMDAYTLLDAGTGSIAVRGASTNTGSGFGVLLNTNAELRGGSVTLVGTGASTSGAGSASVGVVISGAITSTGTVTIEGYGGTGTGTGGAHHGVSIGGPGITGNGAVSISGTGGSGGDNNHGVQLSGATVLSNAGALTVTATAGGGGSSRGLFSGSADTLGGAGQSGNITVRADRFNTPASLSITSTGTATVEPLSGSTSFGSAFNSLRFHFAPSLTGLTLGRAGNTAGITLGQAHSISGAITVHGGAIAIDGALSATNGATPNPTLYNIHLNASGAVTQSAAITAAGLGLNGAGGFTLNHTGNSVGTLAGGSSSARLGSLSFTHATALTVGQVNPTGIWATGNVRVETRSGNLTLGQNINTLSDTTAAVVLGAGTDTAAGTSTGGDIVLSAPVSITMGTGGRATLYTGSLSGSAGLAQANPYDPSATPHWLIPNGSGRFRYGSSGSTTNFSAGLGSGIHAIYRERPSVTISPDAQTIVYGNSPTLLTSRSGSPVNGDTLQEAVPLLPSAVVYDAGNTAAVVASDNGTAYFDTGTYTLRVGTLAPSALGYQRDTATSTLTVDRRAATITAHNAAKFYSQNDPGSFGLSFSGLASGETTIADGTRTVTRAAGENTGAYAITPAGAATSTNYNITYAPGSFTVVPVNQLLVRAGTASVSYGAEASYTPSSVSYVTAANSVTVAPSDAAAFVVGETVALRNGATPLATAKVIGVNSVTGVLQITDVTGDFSVVNTVQRAGVDYGVNASNVLTEISLMASTGTGGSNRVANNRLSFNDNASGTVSFNIDAVGSFNTSGFFNAGSYSLQATDFTQSNLGLSGTVAVAGALEVTPRQLSLSGSKVYDGSNTMTVSLGNLAMGESLVQSGGVLSSANAGTRHVSGITLQNGSGTMGGNAATFLASNYALPDLTQAAAGVNQVTVERREMAVQAAQVYNGTTTLSPDAVRLVAVPGSAQSGLVAGESLVVSAATGSSARAAEANKSVSSLTLADAVGLVSNYSIRSAVGGPALTPTAGTALTTGLAYAAGLNTLSIEARRLHISLTNANVSKVYDGDTSAKVGNGVLSNAAFVPEFVVANAVSGDSFSNSNLTYSANYNSANVVGATAINLSSINLTGLTSSSGSLLSDYTWDLSTSVAASITPRPLAVSGSGVSKVYDGTNSMNNVSVGLVPVSGRAESGLLQGASISVSGGVGSFNSANAGMGVGYTLTSTQQNPLVVSAGAGTQASNYTIPGGGVGTITGNDGVIFKRPLAMTFNGDAKTYDGTRNATVSLSYGNLAYAPVQRNGVTDDVQILRSAIFDTKNVGSANNRVTVSSVSLTGAAAANYTVTYDNTNPLHSPSVGSNAGFNAAASGAITQRDSVTWVGGTSGDWFGPANWALTSDLTFTGVVPDLANVATVVIPSGSTVNFTGMGSGLAVANQPVSISELQGAGATLNVSAGTLNLGNAGATLAALTQSAGAIVSTGSLTVTDAFSQSAGSVSTTGTNAHLGLTQLSGDLSWSSLSAGGNLTLSSAGRVVFGDTSVGGNLLVSTAGAAGAGGVSQSSGALVVAGTSSFTADTGTDQVALLNTASNNFGGAVSFLGANGGRWSNITVTDTDALTVALNASGTSTLNAGGNLVISGDTSTLITSTTAGGSTIFGSTTVTGDLNVTSAGAVGNLANAVLSVSGNANFNGASIDLGNQSGDSVNLGTLTFSSSGTVSISEDSATQLVGTNTAASLVLASAGAISDSVTATLVVGGTTTLTARNTSNAGHAITLDNTGNDFGGQVVVFGSEIRVTDLNALNISVNASGNAFLTAGGNLGVAGNAHNLSTTAMGVNITTTFGQTTLTGDLLTNSTGHIGQTGPLMVDGNAVFNAPGQQITLTNPGNRLRGGVVTTAATVTVTGDVLGDAAEAARLAAEQAIQRAEAERLAAEKAAAEKAAAEKAAAEKAEAEKAAAEKAAAEKAAAEKAAAEKPAADRLSAEKAEAARLALENTGQLHSVLTLMASSQGLLSQGAISPTNVIASAANIVSPQVDVVSSVSTALSGISSAQGVSAVTTPGVQVDVMESPQTTRQGLVAVTLPAGSAISGVGFVFQLPADLVVQFDEKVKVSLENGTPLPAWLRFDPAKGEFSATAVPDRAFPVRVRIEWAGKQLFVVISERQT